MLTFAHGNRNGTGSRLQVELVPAEKDCDGFLRLVITNQSHDDAAAGSRHSFCEEDYVEAELDAKRLSHLLGVLWGDGRSILSGKGLRIPNSDDGQEMTFVHLDAVTAPYDGFALHITQMFGDRKVGEGRIILNCSEARALCSSIEAAMDRVAFGEVGK